MNKLRGKLKIFKKNNKKYIKCVTSKYGQETIDYFEIINSPCVMCGGVNYCKFCKGKDSTIVLKNYE